MILSKSTPAELECFKSFIDKTMPYDYVIDGLNTSLLQTLQQQHSPNAVQAHASLVSKIDREMRKLKLSLST